MPKSAAASICRSVSRFVALTLLSAMTAACGVSVNRAATPIERSAASTELGNRGLTANRITRTSHVLDNDLSAERAHGEGPIRIGHANGKVVIVQFFSMYSGYCHQSLAWAESLLQANDGEVVVIGVNTDPGATNADLAAFAARLHLSFTLTRDVGFVDSTRFKVDAVPTLLIYDRSGKERTRLDGLPADDGAAIESTIAKLAAAKR